MRVLLRAYPHRSIALATDTHVLIFKHSSTATGSNNNSTTSVADNGAPRCVVEFSSLEDANMEDYRSLSSLKVYGTLGLITIGRDVFLCVVSNARQVATVRPGEDVQQILAVEFHCLNRDNYDHLLNDAINPYSDDTIEADNWDYNGQSQRESLMDHPCVTLKKMLSGGSFYFSTDFDLTKRVQDRSAESSTVAVESLDAGFLWNAYMIQPLVDFRSRLAEHERDALDDSGILTSAIRGFAKTVYVPASSSPARFSKQGQPSNMTVISRLSCRRAGTRFNARGIDDDGNVANFVETETIFCTDVLCFSYVQCRGSVPLFWEQANGIPSQQKVTISRSAEATQPAFDKHFEALQRAYGDVVVVNLLSTKVAETSLTRQYDEHIQQFSEKRDPEKVESEHQHLKAINWDYHAETKGVGLDGAERIKRWLIDSAVSFEYFLSEQTQATPRVGPSGRKAVLVGQNEVLKQAGVFRTNCLDCLDRTNHIQHIVSKMALDIFLKQHDEGMPTSDFWARHSTLWADNGDGLSMIYTGTGALKSSHTRHGNRTGILGNFLSQVADVRKSAERVIQNSFIDPHRQRDIDLLLGRLVGQVPVHLYDPINDYVTGELSRRALEYTSSQTITLWVGTFNLNGKTVGLTEDLSPWLCPKVDSALQMPEIMAVAFQEIVDLSPQQIIQTDPYRRQQWEDAVRDTLNRKAAYLGSEDYVMLRGGQLVGASLSIFVKVSVLPYIKNVEGAVKKTGMSGMAGNKGAVAIRMEYADTSICLVTAHLAAGFANYEERNQDYRTIANGLRFQRNRSIDDHKAVIWFGDFNYRIGISNERARQLIDAHEFGKLYENDQLNLQMVHGRAFPHYSESMPNFLPTYKFDPGTDTYDTSEKARIPAWCDRILTKGDNLRQLHYDSAPLKFSDHRPVWGLFQCQINVIDQATKDRISEDLYVKRRAAVQGNSSSAKEFETDEESLVGYESIEPGLPPASSDKRKWWLDNGMPARSAVRPPPNSSHTDASGNPFTPASESDWVQVEKPWPTPKPPTLPTRTRTFEQEQNQATGSNPQSRLRKVNPDAAAASTGPPQLQPAAHTMKQTLRKPAPPKPAPKPSTLRSPSSASNRSSIASTASASQAAGTRPPLPFPRRAAQNASPAPSDSSGRAPIQPPPPRRSGSTAASSVRSTATPPPMPPPARRGTALSHAEQAPGLPPRRTNTGVASSNRGSLMDDDVSSEQEMGAWKPLKPL
jgi:endonuclease/exonuclease/phosphatase family metal-dependent hydrolase